MAVAQRGTGAEFDFYKAQSPATEVLDLLLDPVSHRERVDGGDRRQHELGDRERRGAPGHSGISCFGEPDDTCRGLRSGQPVLSTQAVNRATNTHG